MTERWEWKPGSECDGSDDYYYLFAPDGTEVAALTEPEDRVPYRDLSPVTGALNRLQAAANRVERLEAALRELGGNDPYLTGCSSHACAVKRPVGQGTNSGKCYCDQQTLVRALRSVKQRARAALAEPAEVTP